VLQCPQCGRQLPPGWRVCPLCYTLPAPVPKLVLVVVAPDQPPHWRELFRRGCAAWLAGERQQAVACWQDSLAINPSNHLAHYNLGTCCLNEGQLAEAHRHLLRVRQLKPDYLPGRVNLGTVFLLQGETAAAAHEYAYVLQRDPRHAGARRGLQLARRS